MDGIGVEHVYYNGNKLADFGDPTGLKKLGVEKTPPSVTRECCSTWSARYGTDVVKEGTAFNVKEIEDVAPDATGPRTRTLPRNKSFFGPLRLLTNDGGCNCY